VQDHHEEVDYTRAKADLQLEETRTLRSDAEADGIKEQQARAYVFHHRWTSGFGGISGRLLALQFWGRIGQTIVLLGVCGNSSTNCQLRQPR